MLGVDLARHPEGVVINPFERGEIGPDLFRAACRMERVSGAIRAIASLPITSNAWPPHRARTLIAEQIPFELFEEGDSNKGSLAEVSPPSP